MPKLALLALTICVAGCSATLDPSSDSFCGAARPLQFSRGAIMAMDEDDLLQVFAHNKTGVDKCRWPLRETR